MTKRKRGEWTARLEALSEKKAALGLKPFNGSSLNRRRSVGLNVVAVQNHNKRGGDGR